MYWLVLSRLQQLFLLNSELTRQAGYFNTRSVERVSIPALVAVGSAVPFALKCVDAQGPDC